jgi:hypothetical protein
MNRLKYSIAMALCTVLILACRPGDKPRQEAATANPDTNPALKVDRQLSVTGCLEAGSVGDSTYLLRNIQLEPDKTSDPQRHLTSPQGSGITEGSWVTLKANEDLGAHLGRRVTVAATVLDSGANTIGTAGSSGTVLPSGERSQAASGEHHSTKVKKEAGRIARESMANGTAAHIEVLQVQAVGEACQNSAIRR